MFKVIRKAAAALTPRYIKQNKWPAVNNGVRWGEHQTLAALQLPSHLLVWLTHPPLRLPAGQWQRMMEEGGLGNGDPSLSITHKSPGVSNPHSQ